MADRSDVAFAGDARIHISFGVADLEAAVAFYETLFGTGPTKQREGYARFEVASPPVNLALNAKDGPATTPLPSHHGIQVKSTARVVEATERLRAAGAPTKIEDHETCCHAVQNKVWTEDPDGNAWEVYVVTDDLREAEDAAGASSESSCCEPAPDAFSV